LEILFRKFYLKFFKEYSITNNSEIDKNDNFKNYESAIKLLYKLLARYKYSVYLLGDVT